MSVSDFVLGEEATQILGGVNRRTLFNLSARGELTVYRRAGSRRNYYDRHELEQLARPKATHDCGPFNTVTPQASHDHLDRHSEADDSAVTGGVL